MSPKTTSLRPIALLLGVSLLCGTACSNGAAVVDAPFGDGGPGPQLPDATSSQPDIRPRVDAGFSPVRDRELDGGEDDDGGDDDGGMLPDAGEPDGASPSDGGSVPDVRPMDSGPMTCNPDPGEPNDSCPGEIFTFDEGETQTIVDRRISMTADRDTFTLSFIEATHFCLPGTGQDFNALIELIPPPGVEMRLSYNLQTCNNTFTPLDVLAACLRWGGTCGGNDDLDLFLQVTRVSGQSCEPYTLRVQFCDEGQTCPGC